MRYLILTTYNRSILIVNFKKEININVMMEKLPNHMTDKYNATFS